MSLEANAVLDGEFINVPKTRNTVQKHLNLIVQMIQELPLLRSYFSEAHVHPSCITLRFQGLDIRKANSRTPASVRRSADDEGSLVPLMVSTGNGSQALSGTVSLSYEMQGQAYRIEKEVVYNLVDEAIRILDGLKWMPKKLKPALLAGPPMAHRHPVGSMGNPMEFDDVITPAIAEAPVVSAEPAHPTGVDDMLVFAEQFLRKRTLETDLGLALQLQERIQFELGESSNAVTQHQQAVEEREAQIQALLIQQATARRDLEESQRIKQDATKRSQQQEVLLAEIRGQLNKIQIPQAAIEAFKLVTQA